MYRLFLPVLILAMMTPPPLSAQTGSPPEKKPPVIPLVAGRTIRQWIVDLRNPDPSIRRDAIRAMPQFGEYSFEAVPELVYLLSNDFDTSLRINAAIVLMVVDVRDKEVEKVVKALVAQLGSFQLPLRYHAILSIGRFGPDAASAIPALEIASRDTSCWELRQAACSSLCSVGIHFKDGLNQDKRVVNALIRLLSDPASKVRLQAIRGMATMGKLQHEMYKKPMIDALKYRLNVEKERGILVWVYFTLMINDTTHEVYLDAITNLLKRGDVPTKIEALQALGGLKRDAKKRLPDLGAAILDPDPFVAGTACRIFVDLKRDLGIPDYVLTNIKILIDDEKRPQPLRETAKQAHKELTADDKVAGPDKKKD